MSAEQLDGAFAGPLAQPAVDILPAAGGRKGKQADAEAPAGYPAPAGQPQPEPAQDVFHDAAGPGNPVNPWTGAPADPAALAAMPAPVAAPAAFDFPAPTTISVPSIVPAPYETPAPAAEEPKKFFGMQVRRPKKTEKPEQADRAELAAEVAVAPLPAAGPGPDAPQASIQPWTHDAVAAPVAAWPTDVGVPAVAYAEPTDATGSYAAPAAYAPIDLFADAPADAPPAQPDQPTAEAFTPVAVEAPVAVQAPVVAVDVPVAVPVVDAPVADTSGQGAEVQALRALLEASEAQRLAADTRADQAVTYAQQTQARLQQLEADGQARIQAAEAKARTAANEAQDWQIRHREAEATIAELAASVASSEQRMADLRTERDELLSSLEDATAPATQTQTTTS